MTEMGKKGPFGIGLTYFIRKLREGNRPLGPVGPIEDELEAVAFFRLRQHETDMPLPFIAWAAKEELHSRERLERHEIDLAEKELSVLRKIAHYLLDIRGILAFIGNQYLPQRFVITQGDAMLTGKIAGLVPGASDSFFATPVDALGNADTIPGGVVPTVTSDDAAVTLQTAPDGLSTVASAPATATVGGSFNLAWTVAFTKLDGTPGNITSTVNVPYLPVPAQDPVGFVISQGSPAV